MDTPVSFQCSQQPVSCRYPKQDKPSPYTPDCFFNSPIYAKVFQNVYCLQVFTPESRKNFSYISYVLHDAPISQFIY